MTDRQSLAVAAGEHREAALAQRIQIAVRAGVPWVQIREKDLPARILMDLTRTATQAYKDSPTHDGSRVLVNDRCDVAWAAGAGGVHAGETSLPVRMLVEARRASGLANFLVGASCHSLDGAISAAAEGADYLLFGPVFATPSKAGFGPPQGLEQLAQVCGAVSVPVIAIGGVTVENAWACREAGACGIAAIRLFQESRDLPVIVARLSAQ